VSPVREYDRRKPLISIHIPKCAGTSFVGVLEHWYGRRLYRHYFDERRGRMPERIDLEHGRFGRRRKGVCVHGHFNSDRGFGVREYYPEVEQFITIVRDPFELHLSNFFYLKRLGPRLYRDGGSVAKGTDDTFDLEAYLARKPRSFMLGCFPFALTLSNYRDLLERYFVYIGVSEDLQTSVDRLAERLGFRSVRVPVKNVAERTEEVPQGARDRFIEANPVEWAVYNFAREHYKK
jgi:hypothetical protein